jgi:hypothetical protein
MLLGSVMPFGVSGSVAMRLRGTMTGRVFWASELLPPARLRTVAAVVASLALACVIGVAGARAVTACPGSAGQAGAMVTVQVDYRFAGGAFGAPSGRPAAGVTVLAAAADNGAAKPAASAITDDSGHATLTLSDGSWWLFVPPPDTDVAGPLTAAILVRLPDGTVAAGWTGIEISNGESRTATIAVDVAVP